MILHDFEFEERDVFGLSEWELEVLPGAGEFESDFGEDDPDRILRIVLACVLDLD
jgi:hypothetical protein